MRTPFVFALALFAIASLSGGCSYNPKLKDGELKCSLSGECPEGYECRANACYSRDGKDGGGGKDAGLGGDALPQTLLNRYIGDWTLGVTAVVVTKCGNAAPFSDNLSPAANPSIMTIRAGEAGKSDLISDWLCTLGLRLDDAGAHLYEVDPTCADDSGDPVQTWTATSFEVVAANARTATHTATYNRVDSYANGTVTNCTQMVTAPMTKN